jgi:hypothetical protein
MEIVACVATLDIQVAEIVASRDIHAFLQSSVEFGVDALRHAPVDMGRISAEEFFRSHESGRAGTQRTSQCSRDASRVNNRSQTRHLRVPLTNTTNTLPSRSLGTVALQFPRASIIFLRCEIPDLIKPDL